MERHINIDLKQIEDKINFFKDMINSIIARTNSIGARIKSFIDEVMRVSIQFN